MAKANEDVAYVCGELVTVDEPGIRSWQGTVIAVKFSRVSGWWYDVRDTGSIVRSVQAERLVAA